MTTPSFAAELARRRAELGLSLAAVAARAYLSRQYVHELERGAKRPSPSTAAALDRALEAGGALVGAATERPELTPPDDIDAERLRYAAEHPARVDTASLEALRAVLRHYRRLEDQLGAAAVIEPVQANLALSNELAAAARTAIHPAAVALASEITQYAGWLRIPLGELAEASRLFDRATVLGLESADPDRSAIALSFGAYAALHSGDLRTAAALNAAAAKDTAVHPAQRAYTLFQRAECLARLGDHPAAYAALRDAEQLAEHVPADLPDWGYWYTPAFFQGSRAIVLDKLGEHAEAHRLMTESLAAVPAEWRDSEWIERRRTLLVQ